MIYGVTQGLWLGCGEIRAFFAQYSSQHDLIIKFLVAAAVIEVQSTVVRGGKIKSD